VVRSLGPRLLWLSVTGGEASTRPDLGELLVRTTRAAPRLLYLNLSSNGLRGPELEHALAALLREPDGPRVAVTLSLDGLRASHDRLRGVEGGFERVLDTALRLERLRARAPRLAFTFQITLSAANGPEWPTLARFARERSGGLSPVFSPASEGALLTEGALEVDLRRTAHDAIPRVMGLRDGLPCRFAEDVVTRRYLATLPGFLATRRAPVPCTAGYASWTLEPDGVVRRCDSLDETLGHAREVALDLTRLPATARFRRAFERLPDCRACWTPCQAYPSLLSAGGGTSIGGLEKPPHAA
jgi:MoaA/NifB/PqqE/SkfB family radical SAM enzyme